MPIKTSRTAATLMLAATLLAGGKAAADQVIPDDLIVQGSLCVGFDCVNNEVFDFDTIILKENNLRILFRDTSVGSFPTNDWRLIANDSASGGGNLFAIEDVTGNRRIMTLEAGASTNSIFVDSTGRVGFRTATPVLDLHVNTSNTPGLRLEQNNSGGFTAQTWDIAGNEANFFVRDVTGGSRLSFRIRPGAPTSSIDIASNGNVGMGIGSPKANLDVSTIADNGNPTAILSGGTGTGSNVGQLSFHSNSGNQVVAHVKVVRDGGNSNGAMTFATAAAAAAQERMRIDSTGNVGIGTTGPTARLHTTGSVRFAGVAGCGSGILSDGSGNLSCIGSSRRIKNIAGDLPPDIALANVMALRPQTGSYKVSPDVPEHWLIAEEVAAVDPALVGVHEDRPYVVKTQNIVADLVAVVQQQQREIAELRRLMSGKQ